MGTIPAAQPVAAHRGLFLASAFLVLAFATAPFAQDAPADAKKTARGEDGKSSPEEKLPHPKVDREKRTVTIPAASLKQNVYDVLKGAIEYVLVAKGGKEYESLFTTDVEPEELFKALEDAGVAAGNPATAEEKEGPRGDGVRVWVELEVDGKRVRRPIDAYVVHRERGKPLEAEPWTFTGSTEAFDPEADRKVRQCALTRSLIGLHYTDASPLLQNPRAEAKTENIYVANEKDLPPPGTPVRIVFEGVRREVAEGTRRVQVYVTGRVQGVGFRAFTQREARKLELTGRVKNLDDGRVEATIEGDGKKIDQLLETLKRGPRASKVERLEAKDLEARGDFDTFEIDY